MAAVRPLEVYHYGAGDIRDDAGWGCVYRCLQMLASTVPGLAVPTMGQILDFCGKRTMYARGVRGRDLWLEPPDAARFLESKAHNSIEWLYLPPPRATGAMTTPLEHYRRQHRVIHDKKQLLAILAAHFETHNHPFIIDNGISAYILADYNPHTPRPLLIVDPHVFHRSRATRRHPVEFLTAGRALWMLCSALRKPV